MPKIRCPVCGDKLLPILGEDEEKIVEYRCVSGLHLEAVRYRMLPNNEMEIFYEGKWGKIIKR
jgi:hypothetical protein